MITIVLIINYLNENQKNNNNNNDNINIKGNNNNYNISNNYKDNYCKNSNH